MSQHRSAIAQSRPNQIRSHRIKLAMRSIMLGVPISLLLIWTATGFYCDRPLLRLTLTITTTPFLLAALRKQQTGRQLLIAREQFKWFLELLLTELSSGATFEHAFHQTVNGLSPMLKEKSTFFQALISVNQQLKANQPTTALLQALSEKMSCPEARVFFKLLPNIQTHGSPVAPFVRQQLRTIIEQLSMQQHLQAETAQRRTEAVILVVMPFLVTGLLNTSWDPVFATETIAVVGRLAACLFALSAGILTIFFTAFAPSGTTHFSLPIPVKCQSARIEKKLARLIHRCYRDYLPAAHGSRILRVIIDLGSVNDRILGTPIDWTLLFFVRKIRLMAFALLPSLVICFQLPAAWPLILLLPLLIAWLQDIKWLHLNQKRLSAYSKDYPVLLNLWSALLQTGLSLGRSLTISCDALRAKQSENERNCLPLHTDLNLIQKYLQAGQSAADILTDILSVCPVPEIQTALLLLKKYDQLGGVEALQMIQLQSSSLWTLHRTAVRSQLEKQSIRLLMPMMMSLIAVLISALLPAVISLQAV